MKKNKNHSFSFLSDPIEKSIVKKHTFTDDNKVKYKSNIQDTVQHSILTGSKFLKIITLCFHLNGLKTHIFMIRFIPC